jgi:hypothetical protein
LVRVRIGGRVRDRVGVRVWARVPAVGEHGVDGVDHVHALGDLAEDGVPG